MEQTGKREKFGSRLGFILVSAGCAIGIGNVWKFPYLCGQYGGAAFILLYLIFLFVLGIPVLVCEFSIGRASKRSAAKCFEALEPQGSSWHWLKYISILGCYLLMMYYTTVCGWMLNYCAKHMGGEFIGKDADFITADFTGMLSNAPTMLFWTVLSCVIGFVICFFGVQKGVERVSKYMMSSLLILMIILAVHSVFLKGAGEGIRFYLIPNFANMVEKGVGNVIFAAMSQAFFTLSIGIGAMLIFGSYLRKDRSLSGEAITVTVLDTCVALMAGFIIIPACFAYGIEPDAGPSLIFLTIPNLFTMMPGGRIWGALFFCFLSFAALSTVVAVFENIIAFDMDLFGWSRRKSVVISAVLIILLSIPCVLGYNVWSGFEPLGAGSAVLDLEDFIVSNNLLPLGSLAFVLFCTMKTGWGWDGFIREADAGDGIKFPTGLKNYVSFVLPAIITIIYLKGYYDMFSPMGIKTLIFWMCIAFLFLGFIFFCALRAPRTRKTEMTTD
ncbi:neurotransmitter:Na+ symporter, NSS family [Lachnospiraceae bacterium]|nr:neurotransmitter:Na+ symporter, NSS family [Lachnospiraceae bacterium]